ncbi:MAG: N-acetylmuramoyl-L-alanine amidase [Pseudomonadota bacterium]|nr:N-acetylmuramoyl-L-alanine amidase [Pseudomonadota bacterium]
MKIINHLLHDANEKPYSFRATPNMGKEDLKAKYLVMHYTAGPHAEQAVNWLTNPRAKASAHLVIGRDGNITQLVPFNKVAWHAGRSYWHGISGLNDYAIGIELDNAGVLSRSIEGQWVAWFGDVIASEQVLEAVHKNETSPRGWQLYTPEQLYVALEVASELIEYYRLRDIIGHDDIAPTRKTDPGPAFPLENFRGRLFGRAESGPDETVYRTTVTLNIRSGPGTQHEPLAAGPLPENTRLHILIDEGTWKKVNVLNEIRGVNGLQGWVHHRYITPI